MRYDAIIIGGSFGGLSAALYLGRARRTVCVLDTAKPRNRFTDSSHGQFGHDGSNPLTMLATMREQVAAYALRDTPQWQPFLDLLLPNNRSWAAHASALVYLVSKTTMPAREGSGEIPSPTHSFDTGTASGYMALQAYRMGWAVHGMAGFDHHRLIQTLNVPEGYAAEAGFAIGKRGDPVSLPTALRERERPSNRLPLAELAFEGGFPATL